MKTLQTNDWMILNNIIYKIHSTEDLHVMREQFIEQMKMVLDFDSADFYLTSKDGSKKLTCPVTYNCDIDPCADCKELEHNRMEMYTGASMVCRDTDLFDEERRRKSEYYTKIYRSNNWHYSIHMVLGKGKDFFGIVTFYRAIGKSDFEQDDIFVLDMLKDHLTYRLFKDCQHGASIEEKLTVTQACEKYELTKREHTILSLLMEGKDNFAICNELSISVNTLKKHILNIYRKLGIRNRVQLFKMVRERE